MRAVLTEPGKWFPRRRARRPVAPRRLCVRPRFDELERRDLPSSLALASPVARAAAALSAPLAAKALHPQPVNQLAVTHARSLHGAAENVNPIYVSYLGTADGPSAVYGVRANPAGDGSVFVTGFLTDPNNGTTDAYVGLINPNGAAITLVALTDINGAFNLQGNDVDVGQDGAIYVVGTAAAVGGAGSQGFIARFTANLGAADWIISLTLNGQFDAFNGARIATDPNLGESLFVTGTFGDPNTGKADLAIVELSNLQANPGLLQVGGGGFAFNDPNGAAANTIGNGISVDGNGTAFVAASYAYTDNSDQTAMVVAVPSGLAQAFGVYLVFNAGGAGCTNGSFTSVDVDPHSNIAYLTGSILNTQQGNLHQSLVVSAFSFDPVAQTFTSAYTNGGVPVGGWLWTLTLNGTQIDWYGTGNKVIPGGGSQAVNSTGNDPADPAGIVILFRVGPNGDMSLDANLLNPAFGSDDDRSTGLDIQPDPFGGNDYNAVGFTNSPDFSTTAGSFQPNDPDPTRSLYEGWVGDFQINPLNVHQPGPKTHAAHGRQSSPPAGGMLLNCGVGQTDTRTALVSSTNPSQYGTQVTFTATVTPQGGGGTPTGTVTFKDGNAVLATVNLDANGRASYATTRLIVGMHPITAVYNGDAHFRTSTSAVVNQTVTKAPLKITANDRTKTYGQAVNFVGTEFTTMGLVNGDTVTRVTLASDGAPAAAPVGNYDIVPSNAQGNGLTNYDITYVNGTLTVNKAPLTIRANNQMKVYGQVFMFVGNEFVAMGLVNGDMVNMVALASNGAPAAANVGNYAIVPANAMGVGLNNYNIQYVNGTLTVRPAPLTITATPNTKPYDGTVFAAAIPNVMGLQNADTVTNLSEAYDTKHVGAGKQLHVATFTINDGNGGNNYTVTLVPDNNGVITAVDLLIQATANTKVYDGTVTAAALPAVFGLQVGDAVVGLSEVYDTKNAGVGKTLFVATFTILDGNGGHNYVVRLAVNNNGVINPRPVLLTGMRPYDGTAVAAAAILTVANAVAGDAVGVAAGDAPLASKNVGTQAITGAGTLTLGGPSAPNYTLAGGGGSVTITKAPLTITAAGNSKVYDGTTSAAAVPTVAGLKGTDTATNLRETYDTKHVGTGKTLTVVSFTINDGNGGGNYMVTLVPNTSGVITRAPLTITAATNTKVYDATTSAAATPTVSGLKGTDTVTGLSETYDNKNAGTGKTLSVVSYTVNDGNGGGNYTVTLAPNTTGVITKAPLTIIADNQSKLFGTTFTFTGTEFTAFVLFAGDTVTSVTLTSAGAPAPAPVGSYDIVPSAAVGTGLSNYDITYVNGTMKVTQAVSQGPAMIGHGQVEGMDSQNNPVSGGIGAIAVDPNNPNRVFVGGVNGGIWRTFTSTAVSPAWTPLTDVAASPAITSLAFSPLDRAGNTLFAGTGSLSAAVSLGAPSGGNLLAPGPGGPAAGLLRTTDGGATWVSLGQSTFAGLRVRTVLPTALGADPDHEVVLAGTLDGGGLFRSTDGGTTWTLISGQNATGLPAGSVTQLVDDPGSPTRFYAGVLGQGVFRSADGGQTWAAVNAGLPAIGPATRVELTVSAGAGNPVYAALLDTGTGQLTGVFRSANQGQTWVALDIPGTTESVGGTPTFFGLMPGGRGDLYFAMVASPDPNVVFVAGDRQPGGGLPGEPNFPNASGCNDFSGREFLGDASQPAGRQWSALNCDAANHTSPHAGARVPARAYNGTLLEGDDGGVYRLTNPTDGATRRWVAAVGNLNVTEFYSAAYDAVNHLSIGGAQGVGFVYQAQADTPAWDVVLKGSGGVAAVDNTSTPGASIRYATRAFLQTFLRQTYDAHNMLLGTAPVRLVVNGSGGLTLSQVDPTIPAVTPYVLNAVDPTRLLLGTSYLYESMNQGDLLDPLAGGAAVGMVTALAYGGMMDGVANADVAYVGTAGDNPLLLRTAAGGDFTALTAYPGGTPTAIVLDPSNWQTAYVTDGTAVYVTTDAGATWTDITANLAVLGGDLRSLEVVETGGQVILLAGGFGGLFRADVTNLTPTWTQIGQGIPNVLVTDVHYNAADDVLVVATLGRGIWTIPNASTIVGGSGAPAGSARHGRAPADFSALAVGAPSGTTPTAASASRRPAASDVAPGDALAWAWAAAAVPGAAGRDAWFEDFGTAPHRPVRDPLDIGGLERIAAVEGLEELSAAW